MNRSVVQIVLDLQDATSPVAVRTKRGDTGRNIQVSLSDGGAPYFIADDCLAYLTVKKKNGQKLKRSCRIENGMILYEFDDQVSLHAGKFPAEIKLYSQDGQIITTARFIIDVYDAVFLDGEDVPAGDEDSVIGAMRKEIENLKSMKIPFSDESKQKFSVGIDDVGLYIEME